MSNLAYNQQALDLEHAKFLAEYCIGGSFKERRGKSEANRLYSGDFMEIYLEDIIFGANNYIANIIYQFASGVLYELNIASIIRRDTTFLEKAYKWMMLSDRPNGKPKKHKAFEEVDFETLNLYSNMIVKDLSIETVSDNAKLSNLLSKIKASINMSLLQEEYKLAVEAYIDLHMQLMEDSDKKHELIEELLAFNDKDSYFYVDRPVDDDESYIVLSSFMFSASNPTRDIWLERFKKFNPMELGTIIIDNNFNLYIYLGTRLYSSDPDVVTNQMYGYAARYKRFIEKHAGMSYKKWNWPLERLGKVPLIYPIYKLADDWIPLKNYPDFYATLIISPEAVTSEIKHKCPLLFSVITDLIGQYRQEEIDRLR